MKIAIVFRYLGLLLLLLSGLMLIPFGVSVIYREPDQIPFLISVLITASAGAAMWYFTRRSMSPMQRKESFLVVALAWILASAFGALPYILAGTFTSYVDAYFEAMSGFTTTGASVMTNIEVYPHGILFWRGFTQWLGGMGIITLFIALVPLVGIGSQGATSLYEDEVPAPQADRVTPRIRDTAKALWAIYAGFTVAEILLLTIAGMPLFESITNSLSTMATGGYSPRNASIGHYSNPIVEWIVVAFMVAAGTNFGLYYLMIRGQAEKALRDTELKVYLGILLGCSLLVTFDLMVNGGYMSAPDALRHSAFAIVAQQTTTGFAVANYDIWPGFSKLLILMLMIVGASSGSTGGGFKVARLVIVAKYAYRHLYSVFNPRAVLPLKVGGHVVSDNIVRESIGFFILLQLVFLISLLALAAMDIDIVTAVSGVVATLGNVGPGFGLVGPTQNYAWLPDPAKLIFTLDMLVGRLELWTVLVLLRPSFWRGV